MLKNVVFSLLLSLTSCVKHNTPLPPNMHDLSNYAGPDYEETNSLCIDGLLTNLGNSCDTLVEIQGQGAIRIVQCHKAKSKNNAWDKFTFIVHGTHSLPRPPGAHEFCLDPTTIVYIKERP